MKILIKNAAVINYDKEEKCDIYIVDGKIVKMREGLKEEADKVIDASGKMVLPGLIDIHCHLRDPGYEYKEDIKTGSRSAAKGGFTGIVAMPNTKPVVDNKSVVEYILNKAEKESVVHVYQAGTISKDLEGKELSEMGRMKEAGIVAVTDDGKPVMDSGLMKKAMIYADMLKIPVISHAEDLTLLEGGAMNEGFTATCLGIKGITRAAEETMTSRDIILAKITGTPVHITHVSTKNAVEMIRTAKKQGVKVTADSCPHYFSLTDKACEGFNTNAKMNPPLREEEDRLAIIEGLRDGTLDMIGTDHAPHHRDEKNCEFDKALNGIVGFETAFALAYQILVEENGFHIKDLVKLMSYQPSNLLGIEGGKLAEGKKADIILIDCSKDWICDPDSFVSKSKNSPFSGWNFHVKVTDVIVNGKIVIENEMFA